MRKAPGYCKDRAFGLPAEALQTKIHAPSSSKCGYGLPQCSFSLWVPIYPLSIVVKTNRTENSIETILALWPWVKEEKENECGWSTVTGRERPATVRKLPPEGLWPLSKWEPLNSLQAGM